MGQPDLESLTDQRRAQILDREIRAQICLGSRLESRTGSTATIVSGRPLNDTMHMLLSVMTLGLWLPAWVLMTAFGGEQRRVLRVNADGTVTNTAGPSAHRRGVFIAASVGLFALWAGGAAWFLLMTVDPPGRRTQVHAFVSETPSPESGTPTGPAVAADEAFLVTLRSARLSGRTAQSGFVALSTFADQELLHAGHETCDLLAADAALETAAQRALILHLREDGDGWPPSQYRTFASTAVTYLCPEQPR